MFLQTKARLCGNGLTADTWSRAQMSGGSTLLAPSGLILSTDARPAFCGQHYRCDLCRPLSQCFHRGLTGLGGVNILEAVKARSRGLCEKTQTLLSDESCYRRLGELGVLQGKAWYGEEIGRVPHKPLPPPTQIILSVLWKTASLKHTSLCNSSWLDMT